MLRLVLVRHGETAANAAGRFAGREDAPLTDAGRGMAAALAARFAAERFDAVYTSPLQRARHTVAPVADALGLPLRPDDALVEYDCGGWSGRTRAEVQADEPEAWARFSTDPALHAPPGGETAVQVAERARGALDRIRAAHPDGRVLVASHKGTLRVLVCDWLGVALRDYRRRVDWSLTGVSVVDWTGDGPLVRLHNDVSHLPAALRDQAVDG